MAARYYTDYQEYLELKVTEAELISTILDSEANISELMGEDNQELKAVAAEYRGKWERLEKNTGALWDDVEGKIEDIYE